MPKMKPLGPYELLTLCALTAIVLILAVLGVYAAFGILYFCAGVWP